jgi:hypothetical protein
LVNRFLYTNGYGPVKIFCLLGLILVLDVTHLGLLAPVARLKLDPWLGPDQPIFC